MKLARLILVCIAISSTSALAAGKAKQADPNECPQSLCVSQGEAKYGHARAEAWCKANRKTKLVGPTCAYR